MPYATNSVWIGKMNGIDTRIADIPAEVIEDDKNAMVDENIFKLYDALKNHSKIRWKESIK